MENKAMEMLIKLDNKQVTDICHALRNEALACDELAEKYPESSGKYAERAKEFRQLANYIRAEYVK